MRLINLTRFPYKEDKHQTTSESPETIFGTHSIDKRLISLIGIGGMQSITVSFCTTIANQLVIDAGTGKGRPHRQLITDGALGEGTSSGQAWGLCVLDPRRKQAFGPSGGRGSRSRRPEQTQGRGGHKRETRGEDTLANQTAGPAEVLQWRQTCLRTRKRTPQLRAQLSGGEEGKGPSSLQPLLPSQRDRRRNGPSVLPESGENGPARKPQEREVAC